MHCSNASACTTYAEWEFAVERRHGLQHDDMVSICGEGSRASDPKEQAGGRNDLLRNSHLSIFVVFSTRRVMIDSPRAIRKACISAKSPSELLSSSRRHEIVRSTGAFSRPSGTASMLLIAIPGSRTLCRRGKAARHSSHCSNTKFELYDKSNSSSEGGKMDPSGSWCKSQAVPNARHVSAQRFSAGSNSWNCSGNRPSKARAKCCKAVKLPNVAQSCVHAWLSASCPRVSMWTARKLTGNWQLQDRQLVSNVSSPSRKMKSGKINCLDKQYAPSEQNRGCRRISTNIFGYLMILNACIRHH